MTWVCDRCHYALNADTDDQCVMCNAPVSGRTPSSVRVGRNTLPVNEKLDHVPTPGSVSSPPLSPPPPPTDRRRDKINEPSADPRTSSDDVTSNAIRGRINHLDLRDEQIPANIYRTLSWMLVGVLVIVPYGILFIGSIILCIVFAIIGFRSLSQLFNPFVWTTMIMEFLEVIALRRFRRDERIPVYRGIIEDRTGQEHSFVMFGPLRDGNLLVGQDVELTGERRRGSFVACQGVDLGTASEITSTYRNPWRVIFFVMCGIVAATGFLVLLNWPLVTVRF